MKNFLLISLFLSVQFVFFAQSDWRNINPPQNLITFGANSFKYQSTNDGKIYCIYIYFNGTNDIFQVDSYNHSSQSWDYVYSDSFMSFPGEIKLDYVDDVIYASVLSESGIYTLFNLYRIESGSVFVDYRTTNTSFMNYSSYDFKTTSIGQHYYFIPDANGIDYHLSKYNSFTDDFDNYSIPQFLGKSLYTFQMEVQGDTLWFISGDGSTSELQLIKTHKDNISFITFDNSPNGIVYNGPNVVLMETTISNSNRTNKMSVISEDNMGNKVDITLTNGNLNFTSLSGDYFPPYNSIGQSSGTNKHILFSNFSQDISSTNNHIKVIEKNFGTDTWDIVGPVGSEIFAINENNTSFFDVSYNEITKKYVASYYNSMTANYVLKILNTTPHLDSINGVFQNTLCTTSTPISLFSEFSLWDVNKDPLQIVGVISSDELVIDDVDISYYPISFLDGRTFFDVQVNNTSSGTSTLTFFISDGYDTIPVSGPVTFSSYTISTGNSTEVCDFGTVQLTTTTTNGSGYYTWYDNPPGSGGNIVGYGDTLDIFISTSIPFYVQANDNNCLTNDFLITAIAHPLPIVDAGADITICQSESVTLSGSGDANVTYAWDNGVIDGVSFAPVSSSWFSVVGTDLNGCSNTDAIYINMNNLPIIDAGGPVLYICDGDGITLNASGGDSYLWSTTETTTSITVSPNINTEYNVIGTDFNGCVDTAYVTVGVYALPTPNITHNGNLSFCDGNFVELVSDPAVSYLWSNGDFNSSIFVYGSSSHTVTVTDINGCSATSAPITVTVNPLPNVDAGSDYNVCEGSETSLFGQGADTYVWDNGILNGVPFTINFGQWYNVIGTDVNGCSNSDNIYIGVNGLPIFSAGPDLTVCEGDAVTLTSNGIYSYSWNNGILDGIPFNPTVTSEYVLTATDINGCQNNDTMIVVVNPLPIANITQNGNLIFCEGNSVELTADIADYYSWSTDEVGQTIIVTQSGSYTVTVYNQFGCSAISNPIDVVVNTLPVVDAGADFSVCEGQSTTLNGSGAANLTWSGGVIDGIPFTPLISDMYLLTGTDANGCEGQDYIYLTVDAVPVVDAGADFTKCFGEEITLFGSGADTYVWSNGIVDGVPFTPNLGLNTFALTGYIGNCESTDLIDVLVSPLPNINAGSDINICSGAFITLSGSGGDVYYWDNGVVDQLPFQPLSSNTYVVTGYDANNCQNSDTINVTVNSSPTITVDPTTEVCSGEQKTLNANSTGQIYWYQFAVGGSPIETGNTYLTPNLFSTSTFYAEAFENGCFSSREPIVVNVNELPIVELTGTNTLCGENNGSASAQISGGSSPYDVYWSTGQIDVLTLTDLGAGVYYIFVEDANACSTISSVSVNPSGVEITPTLTNVNCFGEQSGSISLDVQGFGSNVSYLWNTGDNSSTLQNIPAGAYNVTIYGDAGCEASASFEITQANEIVLSSSITPSTCGNSNGAIDVEVAGGNGSFNYVWNSGQTSQDITNIGSGIYSLTATDQNSCSKTIDFYLTDSDAPTVFGNITPVDCNQNNGAIQLDIIPYNGDLIDNISWSNGATTEDISDLLPGYYTSIITTQNNCVYANGWTVMPVKPQTQEICLVSVDSLTTTNLVVWEKVQTSGISHYKIYRETDQANEYLHVGTVDFDLISVFNDVVASPKIKSWRYKLSAIDDCGTESNLSSHHKTIHLTTTNLGVSGTKITWDFYEGNLAFSSYNLWRYTEEFGWENIANLATNVTNYTDNIPYSTIGLDYMLEVELDVLCTAQVWRAESFERSRSNKNRGLFNPGFGTGHPNNEVIELNSTTNNIKIYPNPFESNLTIFVEGNYNSFIQILDISGKECESFGCTSGLNSYNLSKLENGIYFVSFPDKSGFKNIKIIKQ
ncbi:MAG: T9SS type A sorting domain-containing protein [Flavobacteriia bacterium]|nr:T9SS type A sorting domain-containing protein [Flavobacteriia bacterium]